MSEMTSFLHFESIAIAPVLLNSLHVLFRLIDWFDHGEAYFSNKYYNRYITINTPTISLFPLAMAKYSGVRPIISWKSRSQELYTRNFTTSMWLLLHAQCRAVIETFN